MRGNGLIFLGLIVIMGGYTAAYWGQYMMKGQHVNMACLMFGKNC